MLLIPPKFIAALLESASSTSALLIGVLICALAISLLIRRIFVILSPLAIRLFRSSIREAIRLFIAVLLNAGSRAGPLGPWAFADLLDLVL